MNLDRKGGEKRRLFFKAGNVSQKGIHLHSRHIAAIINDNCKDVVNVETHTTKYAIMNSYYCHSVLLYTMTIITVHYRIFGGVCIW